MIRRFTDEGDGKPFIVSVFRRVAIQEFDMLSLNIDDLLSPASLRPAASFSFRICWRGALCCSAARTTTGGLASSVFRSARSRGLSRVPIVISNFA